MLFITAQKGARAAKDYFARSLSSGDYYLRDGHELPGQWHGRGADLLGLNGEVTQDDFYALCDNLHPLTGERLTARTNDERRVAFDITFASPKAVSMAYEVGGDERVLDAFRSSVRDTMAEIEGDMHTRVRRGGVDADRKTANTIWGEFVHRTARPVDGEPDCDLHCHAVVFNATWDPKEERWKAGQFGAIARDMPYYQAAFHARLADRLRDLGYGIERDGNSFTLAGISRATIEKFSRRTAVIEAEAERLGITDAKEKAQLGRRTREAKQTQQSMSDLRASWDARLTDDERAAISAARHAGSDSVNQQLAAKESLDYAMAHGFERSSVVAERRLIAEALTHGVGRTTVESIWQQARAAPLLGNEVDGQRMTTTRDVLREESAMLAFVREGRGKNYKLGGDDKRPDLDPGLSPEQRRAAEKILGSRDTVVGLRGGAGTGKTRMMQATVKAIEATGTKVFTFAPSAKASRGVLRDEGFANADTVEKLLTDEKLRSQVKGQVLWIDEAGLLGTRDMKRVFDLARDEGCRVVLSGDTAQHSAVGRGDALRLLERDAGMQFAQLKDIRRQTSDEYRAAVRDISQGDARGKDGRTLLEAGIDRLDRMGAVIEAGPERFKALARDYVAATAAAATRDAKQKTALVVSPTHAEGEKVAAAIRGALKRAGRLGDREREFASLRPLNMTEAQRGDAGNYRPGEVVRFHQNARGFGRGERVTVASADASGVRVTRQDGRAAMLPLKDARHFQVFKEEAVRLAAGDRVRITQNGFTAETMKAGKPAKSRINNGDVFEVAGFTRKGDIRLANGFVVPKDYGGITQGYVVTSHASQGTTVDTVLIALGRESLAAANRQQFYVSVSRGREAVCLYTDDKQALRDSVRTDASRLSASELMEGGRNRKPRPAAYGEGLRKLRRLHSAYQALRERVAAAHQSWQQRHLGGLQHER